jgi:hypothetical protein
MYYSGCQKNVPIAERFFAKKLMPPSYFWNIMMTSGINLPAGRCQIILKQFMVNRGPQVK